MHATASRWQCEHVARPTEGSGTWELALHITEGGFPAPYTLRPAFKSLADSVTAFPFDNLQKHHRPLFYPVACSEKLSSFNK